MSWHLNLASLLDSPCSNSALCCFWISCTGMNYEPCIGHTALVYQGHLSLSVLTRVDRLRRPLWASVTCKLPVIKVNAKDTMSPQDKVDCKVPPPLCSLFISLSSPCLSLGLKIIIYPLSTICLPSYISLFHEKNLKIR